MNIPEHRTRVLLILLSLLLTTCSSEIDPPTNNSSESVEKTVEAEVITGDLEAAAQTWEQTLEDNPKAAYQLALILLILEPDAALPISQRQNLQILRCHRKLTA
jgi:hypothetical protein